MRYLDMFLEVDSSPVAVSPDRLAERGYPVASVHNEPDSFPKEVLEPSTCTIGNERSGGDDQHHR